MTLVATPPYKTRGARFELVRGDIVTTRLDGSDAIRESPIAKWRLSAPLIPMTYEEAQTWLSAIHQLSRPSAFFNASVPAFEPSEYAKTYHNGSWTQGQPFVDGSGQTGTSVAVEGLVANTTFLTRGDYFGLIEITPSGPVTRLKIVTRHVTSDGAGKAVVEFEPAIRGEAFDGGAVELIDPKVRMRLMDSTAYRLRPNRIVDITLEAVEVYD